MPIDTYFDVVFADSGDKTPVPDDVQPSGSISYLQGWGPFYSQDPTIDPATALLISRAQTNQIFFDITTAIQWFQQGKAAKFITTAMNNGTPFSYDAGDVVYLDGVIYQSLVDTNTDTPPTVKWAEVPLGIGGLSDNRIRLEADADYYVATTGNDSTGTGTALLPWLTIQHAVDYVLNQLDSNGFNVTIHVADGTYLAGATLAGPMLGNGTLTLTGNTSTPSNCVISTGANSCIVADGTAFLYVAGFKLTAPSANPAYGLLALYGSQIQVIGSMEFGAFGSGFHIYGAGGVIRFSTGYTISGNAAVHWAGNGGGTEIANNNTSTITLTGTPAFSSAFALFGTTAILSAIGLTFSGAATGVRYIVTTNSIINTNGAGATYFPGNAAGSAATGGQYI